MTVGYPHQFLEHGLLPRFRQGLVGQRKAEERPIEDLGAGVGRIVDNPDRVRRLST